MGNTCVRETINKAGEKAKTNKIKLILFPEGTRYDSHHGQQPMLPFKKGGFHVALDNSLPILPIVISEYKFLDHDKTVTVRALPPIDTSEYSKETINQLVETTRNRMLETFREISGHVKSD